MFAIGGALCGLIRAPAAKRRVLELSARAVRDAVMMQVLMVLWVANRKVYGPHKLGKAARRAGRDQVARLMAELGLWCFGMREKVFTTKADPDAGRAPDLVNREFRADRPDALWVTDLTYVPTRSGMAYVCSIVDAFSRRIVGWRVASNMRTDMSWLAACAAADASSASWRTPMPTRNLARALHRTPRQIGARPSIGTGADSFDSALAETTNGLCKTECVHGPADTSITGGQGGKVTRLLKVSSDCCSSCWVGRRCCSFVVGLGVGG